MRIVTLDLGVVTPPKDHSDFGAPTVIQGFVIEMTAGVILVDTGMGDEDSRIDALFKPVRRSLATAFAESAIDPDRIVAIVVSHLHFDHVGALREFPGIPIHVQRDELAAARQPRYTIRSRIEDPSLHYIEHAGDDQVCEDVRLIATPGHTPGHQSVAVETNDGLAILACQAAYTPEEWTDPSFAHPAGAGSAWHREHYLKSLNKLRSMNPVEVRFTHDRRVLRPSNEI
ncbi:MAG TPA: MBL fold metallo-hydrolase [Candidatus Binataceae bacterium]|nr:MBL fold metallo-hydrolase [Candidatus Binataceae bacterium]